MELLGSSFWFQLRAITSFTNITLGCKIHMIGVTKTTNEEYFEKRLHLEGSKSQSELRAYVKNELNANKLYFLDILIV